MNTTTKKFEFYSETLKAALEEHAKKHNTTVDDILEVSGYQAKGELAFVPHYEPPKRHGSVSEYPFDFIDYKSRLNREGRSQNTTWYQEFKKVDNGDESWGDVTKMNPADAAKLGLKSGDTVRMTSKTNPEGVWDLGNGQTVPMDGQIQVIEGLRPGVVGFNLDYGHWAYGANDVTIDGEVVPGDPRRQTGIHANAVMRTDTHNPNTTLYCFDTSSVVRLRSSP